MVELNSSTDKLILFSSSLDYSESFLRTINIITPAQIRKVISYSFMSDNCRAEDVDFMFFVGEQRAGQSVANFIQKPHLLTLPAENDKAHYALRVAEAIKAVAPLEQVNYIMLCEDDTFVVSQRFSLFCSQVNPEDKIAYGASAPNSDGGYNLGGGIIMTRALAKAVAEDPLYAPTDKDYAEDALIESIQRVGGVILPEPKLNATRAKRPSANNDLITAHKQNIFDIIEVATLIYPK